MAGIKHAFTSAKSDVADATLVRPSNWNADHVIGDGTLTINALSSVATLTLGTGQSIVLDGSVDPLGQGFGTTFQMYFGANQFGVLWLENSSPGTGGQGLMCYHDSASPAAGDTCGYIDFCGNNASLALTYYATQHGIVRVTTPAGSEAGSYQLKVRSAGAQLTALDINGQAIQAQWGLPLVPAANDGAALGASGLAWSDLFLASGSVINFNAGDVTITHSTNTLTFGGASSGYLYDAVNAPTANDGAALGSGSLSWSDLFLASGGVINFANGDTTITHSTGLLTTNTALKIGAYFSTGNAATRTGSTYTVVDGDVSLIFATSATCTITLPSAASYPGRLLFIKNIRAFALNSNASNVDDIAGVGLSAVILPATAGKWCIMHAYAPGPFWEIMATNV